MLQLLMVVIYSFLFGESQCDDYNGVSIGAFVTHAHLVQGDVFAVNDSAILIKNFNYDGIDKDAFFWGGYDSETPNGRGFIIPDELGTTNVLKSYLNKNIILLLPDRYKLSNMKWIAIYNIRGQSVLADVIFPSDFTAPITQVIESFHDTSSGVSSKLIEIVDTRTIRIPGFSFDGKTQNTFFWVGNGEKPNENGYKMPNDEGSLEPLGRYRDKTITLYLPGDKSIVDLDYLSVWCVTCGTGKSLGYVLIRKDLKIPPAFGKYVASSTSMSNCESLHQRLEISWAIFGTYITIQLSGNIAENEYMAFGISSNNKSSEMVGADITVAWRMLNESKADDYYVDAESQCSGGRGVCPDLAIGGSNDNQYLGSKSENGIVTVIYRRPLNPINLNLDREIYNSPMKPNYIVWGIGPRDSKNLPRSFTLKITGNMTLNFGRKPVKNCFGFYIGVAPRPLNAWDYIRQIGKDSKTFSARIGPAGGRRGYAAITGIPSWGSAWYINGSLIPELILKRGETYTFIVEGGSNASDPVSYHPFYITSDAEGGFGQKTEDERSKETIYAGVIMNKERKYTPLAVGRLCEWTQNIHSDPDSYHDFSSFFETLRLKCYEGNFGTLKWTPNATTPDTVYYQCYNHKSMGWRMRIVDAFTDMQYSVASGTTTITSFNSLIYFIFIYILYCHF